MSPADWFRKYIGTAIAVPGIRPDEFGQCAVAMNSYLHDVLNQPYLYTPTAIGIWTGSLLNSRGFVKMPPGVPILPGDFVFYDARVGSPAGHVSIASRGGSLGDFYAYDSNWGGDAFKKNGFPTLHEVRHNDKYNNYIVGIYRFNAGKGASLPVATITTKAKDSVMMIQNTDGWFARCMKTMQRERGRDLSREEFTRYAVGNDFAAWFASVQDNAESDAAYNALKTGQAALQQDWQGQISTLNTTLAGVRSELLKLQQTPEVVKIINKCDVDLDTLDEDKVGFLVRFVAWLTSKK